MELDMSRSIVIARIALKHSKSGIMTVSLVRRAVNFGKRSAEVHALANVLVHHDGLVLVHSAVFLAKQTMRNR